MPESRRIRVGISVGDLNGIGMEVIIKTLADVRQLGDVCCTVYGNPKAASYHRRVLDMQDFSFNIINKIEDAKPNKPNLLVVSDEEIPLELGKASTTTGAFSFQSLEAACKDLASGNIDVLVTAPIDKNSIQSKDFNFQGHTEYLTALSNVDESLMLMVADDLRVGLITNHLPLKDVAAAITQEKIITKAKLLEQTLIKDFSIRKPRIAILGLNPHSGDQGLLGEEEKEIIKPAVKTLFNDGMLAFGPYPADGFFGSGEFKKFDGVLAMYHDQGLAPFKALTFDSGVNYTAGLPIVRTSPDHGVAYDIAGKGVASEASFRQALFLACDVFNNRSLYKEITANPLEIKPAQRRRDD